MANYSISLTGEELVIVGEGISALPFKQVATLMAKIQAQINEQDAARVAASAEQEKPE